MEYVAAALLVNTVYGAATGETGGLIGQVFGVQDNIDAKQAQAKQDADARTAAIVASNKATADAADAAAKANADAAAKATADAAAAQQAASATAAAATKPDLVNNAPATTTAVTLATPPVPATPAPMPVASQTMNTAVRASIAEQRRRQGRASTILTDTLGGG